MKLMNSIVNINGCNIREMKEYIDSFKLKLNDDIYNVYISFCHVEIFNNNEIIKSFLNDKEMKYYNTLLYKRRKNSYLLGRYSAKKAFSKLIGQNNLKKINIKNGVFEQPVIVCSGEGNIDVSISHSDNIGAAVVFDNSLIIGIDIEEVSSKKHIGIEAQLTSYEKSLAYIVNNSYEKFLYMLWTIKEALSKALKTGLTLDFTILEVKSIEEYDGYFVSEFKNFPQYKSVSFFINNYVYSIVYPINVEADIDIKRIKTNLLKLVT